MDALLAQRRIAAHLLGRGAHYMMPVKDNQKTLRADIERWFEDCADREPDHVDRPKRPSHGRIEHREIWVTTEPSGYLEFPGVGQSWAIRKTTRTIRQGRQVGRTTVETTYGVTSHTPESAGPERLPRIKRGHWAVGNSLHHVLDHNANWSEDRSRIRIGYGPEVMKTLRRFAVVVIGNVIRRRGEKKREAGKRNPVPDSAKDIIEELKCNGRLLLDVLRLTENARGHPQRFQSDPG